MSNIKIKGWDIAAIKVGIWMGHKEISHKIRSNKKNYLPYFEKIKKLIRYQEKLYNMKYINGEFYPKERNGNDRKRKKSKD
jgi:hypothetical protein